ncbi:MAG: dihydrodipicolinate reductase C-terminal domain-containing protein [Polaromonas sp.]|nr:dihydrodipicolinate reductase C-terminal domain-containing protein [Polaromonas sp.]
MHVFIAGAGKLATELLDQLAQGSPFNVSPWSGALDAGARAIVVHAGSGREMGEIERFCRRTSSVLVELATGSSMEGQQPGFPVVLCPNTNILMLKFICMLERAGPLFAGSRISITESHQASKASVPGSAVAMAHALGVAASGVRSVRSASEQATELGIPTEHLARHAYHRIEIHEGPCTIAMETRVYGESPYASGLRQLIVAIQQRPLQTRVYGVNEFIENGWV